jgi:hypothetical protein
MDAAMEGVGERVGQMMETEAAREPEGEKPRRKSMSMEDLRRKYSWWPSGDRKEGQPGPLIDVVYEDVIPYTPAPLLQELGLKKKTHTRESRNTRKARTLDTPTSVLVVTHIHPIV